MTITLPISVWRSVHSAIADYLQFGPGNLDAEYVPDADLERAVKEIGERIMASDKTMAQLMSERADLGIKD